MSIRVNDRVFANKGVGKYEIELINNKIDDLNVVENELSNSISAIFSESEEYKKGDYIKYNGILYRFNSDKPIGKWNDLIVSAINIGDELKRIDNNKVTMSVSADGVSFQSYSNGDATEELATTVAQHSTKLSNLSDKTDILDNNRTVVTKDGERLLFQNYVTDDPALQLSSTVATHTSQISNLSNKIDTLGVNKISIIAQKYDIPSGISYLDVDIKTLGFSSNPIACICVSGSDPWSMISWYKYNSTNGILEFVKKDTSQNIENMYVKLIIFS